MSRQTPTSKSSAPRRRGRPPRPDLRAHLLDHTLRVLLRDGMEGFSMASVATSARASKETLYRHFGDKSGLLGAALERVGERVAPLLLRGLTDGMPRTDRLMALGRNYLGGLLEPESLTLQRIAFADTERGLGPLFARSFSDAARGVVTDELRAMGTPEPALDAEVFLGMVRGHVHERALLGVPRGAGRRSREAVVAHAVRIFEAYLDLVRPA